MVSLVKSSLKELPILKLRLGVFNVTCIRGHFFLIHIIKDHTYQDINLINSYCPGPGTLAASSCSILGFLESIVTP